MSKGLLTAVGPEEQASILSLLDLAFPGVRAGIEAAERILGYRWFEVSTPFSWFEDGEAIAHVGLLRHPVRLAGEDRVIGGLHAVCSHPAHRGRGLVHRCMAAALEAVNRDHDAAKLHTEIFDFYRRFGFEVAPMHAVRWTRAGGGGAGRWLRPSERPEDARRLVDALRVRPALGGRLESRDEGWLVGIDACLQRRLDRTFVELPDGTVLGGARTDDGRLELDLVAGRSEVDIATAIDGFPERFTEVALSFDLGAVPPSGAVVPRPDDLMVRGRWPEGSVAVSPLWEH